MATSPEQVQQHQVVDYLLPRKTVEKLSGLSRATIYRLIKLRSYVLYKRKDRHYADLA